MSILRLKLITLLWKLLLLFPWSNKGARFPEMGYSPLYVKYGKCNVVYLTCHSGTNLMNVPNIDPWCHLPSDLVCQAWSNDVMKLTSATRYVNMMPDVDIRTMMTLSTLHCHNDHTATRLPLKESNHINVRLLLRTTYIFVLKFVSLLIYTLINQFTHYQSNIVILIDIYNKRDVSMMACYVAWH